MRHFISNATGGGKGKEKKGKEREKKKRRCNRERLHSFCGRASLTSKDPEEKKKKGKKREGKRRRGLKAGNVLGSLVWGGGKKQKRRRKESPLLGGLRVAPARERQTGGKEKEKR